jgi:hypothetical protein
MPLADLHGEASRCLDHDVGAAAEHYNFSPAAALESLHTEIVEIEAFAHAAGEAVTFLPHASNPEDRRTFARIYTLSRGSPTTWALWSHMATS